MSLEFLVHLFPEVNNREKYHKLGSTCFLIKPFFFPSFLVLLQRDPYHCSKNNKEAEEQNSSLFVAL